MLRRFAGPRRRPEEDYLLWVVRCTRAVEESMRAAGMKPCLDLYLTRKWLWAGRIMRMDRFRWTRRVTTWRDGFWWRRQPKDLLTPARAKRTHWFRWEDELARFAESQKWTSWQEEAISQSEQQWLLFSDAFCRFTCRNLHKRSQ